MKGPFRQAPHERKTTNRQRHKNSGNAILRDQLIQVSTRARDCVRIDRRIGRVDRSLRERAEASTRNEGQRHSRNIKEFLQVITPPLLQVVSKSNETPFLFASRRTEGRKLSEQRE